MKTKSYILYLLFLAIGISLLAFISATDFANTSPTIYYNGAILTLDEKSPYAEAMYIKDGKIVEVGGMNAMSSYDNGSVNKVDLKGKTVLPGFIDIHTHYALSMFLEGMHDLSGFEHDSNSSVWNSFIDKVRATDSSAWILCKGLDPILVKDLQIPSIHFLDSLAPYNPVVILSQSLHSYWANSRAFELAGITTDTRNPSKHSFYERDVEGDFTGLIVEQEAFKPFLEIIKQEVLTTKYLGEISVKVMNDYANNGNTTIVSTGLTINDHKPLILTEHLSTENPSILSGLLATFGLLPQREPLPRHFIYMRYDMAHLMPQKLEANDFYGVIGIKHWYDGSPYIGSMYMNEPYLETALTTDKLDIDIGSRGEPLVGQSRLKEFIRKYHNQGWQIAIHTQGDAAIQEVIEVYKNLAEEIDFSTSRHRLEHCLMLQNSQLDQMKMLNLTPSFHINHLYYYGDALNTEILGQRRTDKILPVNSAFQKRIVSTLHADQPMFKSKPFRLIQTAVERKTRDGQVLIGGEEKINLIDAIKSLTIHAAWQINMEDKIGSLEKGKYADFIILDKDPLTTPVSELHTIRCLDTYINGNLVRKDSQN